MLAQIEATRADGDGDYADLIAELGRLQDADPATQAPLPRLGELLIERGVATVADVRLAARQQQLGDPRRIGDILVDHGIIAPGEVVDALMAQAGPRDPLIADSSVRVDVALLDHVMRLVGELAQVCSEIAELSATSREPALSDASHRLNLLIADDLHTGVVETRMQPIGNVFGKVPRIVRDLSVSCGKQVRVEMRGTQTKLDKTIIEAIKDPLTHLVRNCVDHGIETARQRVNAGKPAEGVLVLHAYREDGHVTDDGAGVDVQRVKAKAVERGLMSGHQAARMGDREATGLIFVPGFSTAETVTTVSGRGVGLDVVRTNIERIGGTVEVATQPGAGTTFRVRVP